MAPPRNDISRGWFLAGGALLVFVQLLLSLFHIHDVPLIDPDEPRYAAAGRTMAEGGSWLIPEFNAEPRINKPPLFYWMVGASCVMGGGSNELTSRAPSILMGLLMLGLTVGLAARLFSRRTALIAGAMLVSLPIYVVLSRTCITDMTLSSLLTGALAMLLLVILQKVPPRAGIWIAAIFYGLAILAKATPALVVILIVMIDRALALPLPLPREERRFMRWTPWILAAAVALSGASQWFYEAANEIEKFSHTASFTAEAEASLQRYAWLDRVLGGAARLLGVWGIVIIAVCAWKSGLGALKGLPWRPALATAFVVGLWWYGVVVGTFGWERFRELIDVEVAGRLAGQMHREPMHFYLYMILVLAFPWSIGLIGALGAAWPSARTDATAEGRAERFLIAWILGVVLFFCIPGAKLPTYLLPAMPALAILVARFIERWSDAARPVAWRWKIVTWTLTGLTSIVLAVFVMNPGLIEGEHHVFVEQFPMPLWVFAALICLCFGGGWLLVMRGKTAAAVALLFAATVGAMLIGIPATLHNLELRSSRALCNVVRDRIGDAIHEGRVASVGAEVQSLSYYLHATVHETRRRRLARVTPEPGEEPVTEDESFSAVVEEELARPEKVVLFIQRRYFARMLGTNRKTQATYSLQKIIQSLPAGCRFIGLNDEMIVIRNLR